MTAVIVLMSQAVKDDIGLIFTWFVLLPAVAIGLIIVAVVAARGEKAEDDERVGRWSRRGRPE